MVAIGSGCGVWLGPATNSVKRVSTRPRDASRRVVGVAFRTPIELRFGSPELISFPSSASPCFPNFSFLSLTYPFHFSVNSNRLVCALLLENFHCVLLCEYFWMFCSTICVQAQRLSLTAVPEVASWCKRDNLSSITSIPSQCTV